MSWTYWGIVAGIISTVAVLLFCILTVYASSNRSLPSRKRLGVAVKPEPLVHRRAA